MLNISIISALGSHNSRNRLCLWKRKSTGRPILKENVKIR
jgi:hypothetical protein